MAVGVTLWVANSQSRQRRRQLRQVAVLDINTTSNEWISAASGYLGYVRHYIATRGGIQTPWSVERLESPSNATAKMDRAVKAAQMICTDTEIQRQLTRIGLILKTFLELSAGPYPEDPAENQERIGQLSTSGLAIIEQFVAATETLLDRGFSKYGVRRNLLFRIRRKLAKPVEPPSLPPTTTSDSKP
jgi:hypothetical protein